MKGTVVSTWLKTCRKVYNDSVVDKAMENAGLSSSHTFSPIEDVDDNLVNKLIGNIGKEANIEVSKLWRVIGNDNVITFSTDYPAFFRHESLYQFLKSMNDVHKIVVKRIPGSKPPALDLEPISKYEATFTYRSKRGMFDYFLGLLEGASKHFNENVNVEEISRNNGELQIKLKFEKEIYNKRVYKLNKIMSFGFIKDINVKKGILGTIIFGLIGMPIGFISKDIFMYIAPIIAFISFLISAKLMSRPLNIVLDEFEKLKNHNFVETGVLETNDVYEELYDILNECKDVIRKDFVGFKGITDEMNTFSNTLDFIANKMGDTSEEISSVVEQVATAAMTQAEETEGAVNVLNDNIEGIKNVAHMEARNKEELESSIEKIESSYKNVKITADKLNDILKSFGMVKQNGLNLQDKARNITQIVSIVSSIAYQTNLLALNASIEAARAGEMGRGFAVVADEVRKLAEQSQDAVSNINDNLMEFIGEIENLVSDVEVQFNILEEENYKLKDAVSESDTAKDRMKDISNKMIETAEILQKETDSIASVYENIESLAAIAEENSASSQEVSSSVTTYTEEIKNLTRSVSDFKKITDNFREDINIYKI